MAENELKQAGEETAPKTDKKDLAKTKLSETAKKLMEENKVDKIYRTKDDTWFTSKNLAELHKRSIGGEIDEFVNNTNTK